MLPVSRLVMAQAGMSRSMGLLVPRVSRSVPFGRRMASSVAAAPAAVQSTTSSSEEESPSSPHVTERWKSLDKPTLAELPGIYLELSKARLAALVVLSTMGGYAIAPGDANVPTLLATTIGTGLCVASANSINQWIEVPYDAQMQRTAARPLVRRAASAPHALGFGLTTGIAGTAMLYSLVNPITAALGLSDIFLYTLCYTPLKRLSISNTWVGSVVGAIPPVMGWTACTGGIDAGALLLGYILYAWQFPHFNSLAWRLKAEYSKAGYRMTAVTDPSLNTRVAFRHAALMIPASMGLTAAGVTTEWFLVDGTILNLVFTYFGYKFHQNPNEKTSRKLFFGSLFYLPAIIILMLIHKRGPQKKAEEKKEEEQTLAIAA